MDDSIHYGRKRGSSTVHIVRNVYGWYSGMTRSSICGVRGLDVTEIIKSTPLPNTICLRCANIRER